MKLNSKQIILSYAFVYANNMCDARARARTHIHTHTHQYRSPPPKKKKNENSWLRPC